MTSKFSVPTPDDAVDLVAAVGLMTDKIRSYDNFVHTAARIVRETPPINIRVSDGEYHVYHLGNVVFKRGDATPHMCRLTDSTYGLQMIVDVTHQHIKDNVLKKSVTAPVTFCTLPLMLRSSMCALNDINAVALNECPHDKGGYYVINGGERCLIGQERLEYNKVHVWPPVKPAEKKAYSLIAECRGVRVRGTCPSVCKVFYSKSAPLKCFVTPTTHMFDDVVYAVGLADGAWSNVAAASERYGRDLAVVDREIQIPPAFLFQTENRWMFLRYMEERIMHVAIDGAETDDRDNFVNKRVDSDGKLLEDLFRLGLAKMLEKTRMALVTRPTSLNAFTNDGQITSLIMACMTTGKWGAKNGFVKKGVSQIVTRVNPISALSHCRRTSSTQQSESLSLDGRQLHPSQYGIMDPVQTPDGKSSGIMKNLSVGTIVSIGSSEDTVIKVCKGLGLGTESGVYVFAAGCLVGTTDDPDAVVAQLRALRDIGALHPHTSIAFHKAYNEISVKCDSGRCLRPLVPHDKRHLWGTMPVSEMFARGVIVYRDTVEEQTLLVGENFQVPDRDLYEIHPLLLLGVNSNSIPWINHEQSPRGAYGCNMMNQSIGMSGLNAQQRFDSLAYTLWMPQTPLVHTKLSKLVGYVDVPTGQNAIVAVMVLDGFNQEDSIILNRGAVQRGLFAATHNKTYTFEESLSGTHSIDMLVSPKDSSVPYRNLEYFKLDDRGIIRKGMLVQEGDVLIRKAVKKNGVVTDESIVYKNDEVGYVDDVSVIPSPRGGGRVVKVRIGFTRIPIIGDKFSSVHAQKGTCGIVMAQEDMPFTSDGICPDIIINPSCMPSRMTISHLIETVVGKTTCMTGEFTDATPFQDMVSTIRGVHSALHAHGYQKNGEEAMYSGTTGELLAGTVFIGPTYYRRLVHMIMSKLSARARGSVHPLTMQPNNHGRKNGAKNTSIRYGHMENNAMNSHGAAHMTVERLLHSSDKYVMSVCSECGAGCTASCAVCTARGRAGVPVTVTVPYAFKLATQYLAGCHIKAGVKA